MDNYFVKLSQISCNGHVEKKNGLNYLSWGYAWQMLKEQYPDANYKVYENAQGWNYYTDGRTGWVKTGVTVNGIEHIETLAIMDNKNNSIPLERITSTIVNKTIQRSITKAIARHGLGISLYTGDFSDLPEQEAQPQQQPAIDEDTYWKIVAAAADGKVSKSGADYRTTFIQVARPTAEALAIFDNHVQLRRAAIGK